MLGASISCCQLDRLVGVVPHHVLNAGVDLVQQVVGCVQIFFKYLLIYFLLPKGYLTIWPGPDVDVEHLVVVVHSEGVGAVLPPMLTVPHHKPSIFIH